LHLTANDFQSFRKQPMDFQSIVVELWAAWGIGKTMQVLVGRREMTNKGWVLGEMRFKRKGAEQLERRVGLSAKGGDRRSEEYRKRA